MWVEDTTHNCQGLLMIINRGRHHRHWWSLFSYCWIKPIQCQKLVIVSTTCVGGFGTKHVCTSDYATVVKAWRVRVMFVSMEFFLFKFFFLSLSLARSQTTANRKESQNSIHIKIMYRRIYDFKWRLFHSTIFFVHTY